MTRLTSIREVIASPSHRPGSIMEPQIWLKTEEKVSSFLVLRGTEVSRIRVTGNVLTLKKKTKGVMEALHLGSSPADSGGNVVGTLDARSITKAELSPENDSLTLYGEGENPTKIDFSAPRKDADQILSAILDRSGRVFQKTTEEIGIIEAVIPPVIVGAVVGLFWMGLYGTATDVDAGKEIAVTGRRQGMKKLMILLGQMLGTNGTLAVGGLLLALIVGWMAMRVIKRPERSVWRPASA